MAGRLGYGATVSNITLRTALLTLATEVFREQADKDYIVARSCYRMNLREQSLWASLQACEKYLKATLLFNEKSARYDPAKHNPAKAQNREYGHDVRWLFEVVRRDIPDLRLDQAPDWLPKFLSYLVEFGDNRYLSKATYATGDELRYLDETVWILRRVCQNFDWSPERKNLRPQLIAAALQPASRKNPALYRPFGAIGGFLETTLKAPANNPARQALVWNNMFVANRQRHRLTYTHFSSSENPPQTRDWFSDDPAIIGKIDFYVKLPKPKK
jgi:hypothetical protein